MNPAHRDGGGGLHPFDFLKHQPSGGPPKPYRGGNSCVGEKCGDFVFFYVHIHQTKQTPLCLIHSPEMQKKTLSIHLIVRRNSYFVGRAGSAGSAGGGPGARYPPRRASGTRALARGVRVGFLQLGGKTNTDPRYTEDTAERHWGGDLYFSSNGQRRAKRRLRSTPRMNAPCYLVPVAFHSGTVHLPVWNQSRPVGGKKSLGRMGSFKYFFEFQEKCIILRVSLRKKRRIFCCKNIALNAA